MGGVGSGRYWRWNTKDTTSDYLAFDIRRWARDGLLVPGNSFGWHWSHDGERIGDIRVAIEGLGARLKYRTRDGGGDWEPMEYLVRTVSQPCNFGGYRQWFVCPVQGCGRRVAILYGGKVFACRDCHQLVYPSQSEESYQRASRRADRIRERLGWDDDVGYGEKPKGMHWATFHRLTEELDYWDEMWNSDFTARFAGLLPPQI